LQTILSNCPWLKTHFQRQNECLMIHWNKEEILYNTSQENSLEFDNYIVASDDIDDQNDDSSISIIETDEIGVFRFPADSDQTLINYEVEYQMSGYAHLINANPVFKSHIQLLSILNKAKCPVYLFDEVLKWAKNAALKNNVNFSLNDIGNRKTCIKNLTNQFDLTGLLPTTKKNIKRIPKSNRVNSS
jgi:hypothetical protein